MRKKVMEIITNRPHGNSLITDRPQIFVSVNQFPLRMVTKQLIVVDFLYGIITKM